MKQYNLKFSTCPNDTFMFDALVNGKIDCRGIEFDVELLDIEQLNQKSLISEADITKISYAIYPLISDKYTLLRSGSAIGYGNAPLIVTKKGFKAKPFNEMVVALPGEHTTAALLTKRLYSDINNYKYYIFSDIAEAVQKGEVDCGVLIHEERFTYQDRGLELLIDLGKEWESRYALPVPLGAIVARNSFDKTQIELINSVIADSVQYALTNPMSSRGYIKKYAQELSDSVIDSHIKMFVNNFSIDVGELGNRAIEKLLIGNL